jgi:hypothetical protein
MAEALALAKRAAPTRPHPRAPDTPPGNLVAGAVSAVLDMGKDAMRAARRKAEGLSPMPATLAGKRPRKTRAAEDTSRESRQEDLELEQDSGGETHYLM